MSEAVIIDAVRTPIARGKAAIGELTGLHATELLAKPLEALVQRSELDYAAPEVGHPQHILGKPVVAHLEQGRPLHLDERG